MVSKFQDAGVPGTKLWKSWKSNMLATDVSRAQPLASGNSCQDGTSVPGPGCLRGVRGADRKSPLLFQASNGKEPEELLDPAALVTNTR